MITQNDKAISEWSMLVEAVLPMLLEECKENTSLRDNMRREDKNLEDMAKYIYGKVREASKGQKCSVMADNKVLELAIEYFELNEDKNGQDAE